MSDILANSRNAMEWPYICHEIAQFAQLDLAVWFFFAAEL